MVDLLRDGLTVVLLIAAAGFFGAGTIGLLRFPDALCRLHALTKADSVGLGLTVLALLPQVGTLMAAVKLLLIWLVAVIGSATIANLFATLPSAPLPPDQQRDGP